MQLFIKKMILGVGTDLISVTRIEKLISQFQQKFAEKVFTENEISHAKKFENTLPRALFFAKRFAAKEAFAKAIGLGIGRGVDFKDIEVENDKLGKPQIKILNRKNAFLKKHFGCKDFAIHLSLTDERSFASAFVVIEKIS
ncbi:MAG: holo-ACP synthase [Rickettsiales bacterium]|nr:holo-ACP synthase [Rickettsiales bacterium]